MDDFPKFWLFSDQGKLDEMFTFEKIRKKYPSHMARAHIWYTYRLKTLTWHWNKKNKMEKIGHFVLNPWQLIQHHM